MRRCWIVVPLLLLVGLAGCGPDYTQAGEDEVPLASMYEAAAAEPYPLTAPVIVGCNYFRIPGEKEQRPLGELINYNANPDSFEWITGAQEWSERMCAS